MVALAQIAARAAAAAGLPVRMALAKTVAQAAPLRQEMALVAAATMGEVPPLVPIPREALVLAVLVALLQTALPAAQEVHRAVQEPLVRMDLAAAVAAAITPNSVRPDAAAMVVLG
jgi:hypothetical protein